MTVGVRCSGPQLLSRKRFEVIDQDGKQVATGSVGDETWPGTTSLVYAETTLEAPPNEGHYKWQVRTEASEETIPHEAGAITFGLKVVPKPECQVRVQVLDGERDAPVHKAHVLLHPFRTFTDEHGIAVLNVPKGEYNLHVSGFKYVPHRSTLRVEGDLATIATVTQEPEDELLGGS